MADGKAQAKAAPAKDRIICQRTDLPLRQRKPVQEAVRMLFQNIVKNGQDDKKRGPNMRWGEFARALKGSLDKSFEPHWHVIVGSNLGFACKKLDQTMGLWRVGDVSIVIWKSPGIEGPPMSPGAGSSASSEAKAAEATEAKAADAAGAKAAGGAKSGAASLRVHEPKTVEAGSEVERTIALMREEIAGAPTDDALEIAQAVRRRLTSELGTIWHVVTGADFDAAVAEDARNHVVATAGKLRIVCFQHEQFRARRIDFAKIAKSLPYLLVVIFFFGYMTLNSVCQEKGPSTDHPLAWWIRNRFCHEGWEQDMFSVGGCALAGLFISKKWRSFFPEAKV